MTGLERAVRSAILELDLLELARIRASQINGCAYCLAMNSRDARPAASMPHGSTPSPPGGTPPAAPPGSGPRWPGARR